MIEWLKNLQYRERCLILILSIALLVVLLYQHIWQPIQNHLQRHQYQVILLNALLTRMESQTPYLKDKKNRINVKNEDIPNILDDTAKKFQITLNKYKQESDVLSIEVPSMPYTRLMTWLSFLEQKYGIRVNNIELHRSEPSGVVVIKHLTLGIAKKAS